MNFLIGGRSNEDRQNVAQVQKRPQKNIPFNSPIGKKINHFVHLLAEDLPLPTNAHPHMLIGQFAGFHECHVAPDMLLVYSVTDDVLLLYRVGSHSKLGLA